MELEELYLDHASDADAEDDVLCDDYLPFGPDDDDERTEVAKPHHSGWDEPSPLGGTTEAPPFHCELLPRVLRPWVTDVAERMQAPVDFVAVAAMVMLAGVVGRKVGIRPKRLDDWVVVSNLWGVCIGPPGSKKTPAVTEGIAPLNSLDSAARREHANAMADYENQSAVYEVLKAEMRKQMREASREEDGKTPETVLAEYAEHDPGSPPTCRRKLVHDSTPEKMQELLAQNGHGLTQFRDELLGFVAAMDKPGREDARKFYLESWNGTGSFSTDRIGRGSLFIPKVCLSIIGGSQPDAWQAYVDEAVKGSAGSDGFLQRFQLAVYPDRPSSYRHVDRPPDDEAKAAVLSLVEDLDQLDTATIGATPDEDAERDIPYIRFDSEAQKVFDGWLIALEERLLRGVEHPAFEAHLSKYRSLMPSLALLCHLGDGGRGPVPVAAAQQAAAWCRYLEAHARRIYGRSNSPADRSALLLARRIVARDLPSRFTVRDVYRKKWAGLGEKKDAERAVRVLYEADWLDSRQVTTGGRPRIDYVVNPYVYDLAEDLVTNSV